ncbi:MAG: ABC transporter ATP-binding protein [Duodenibacillus sp.]|nr:ABC transporter ATP-binding protein [Duodenibacillus sp.]
MIMVIEAGHISKSFGPQNVLNDVSLNIDNGERVIILGQNGAGKTTLLRCLLGQYRLDSGSVRLCGADPVTDRQTALANVAFIPQLPPPLPFSVHELFRYASCTSGLDVHEAEHYCDCFGLSVKEHYGKAFSKLSGGMKQKVLAALAFARHASVMLFDEPTANLDTEGRRVFGEIIRDSRFSETTMVFISHRLEELNAVLNRAVWLDLGKVVKDEKL